MSSKTLMWFCLAIGIFAAILAPTRAFAQDANRDVVVTKADVGDIVTRLADRTEKFKGEFDKEVEHTSMQGTKREDRAEDRVKDLHESAKKLREVYEDKKDKNHPEVRDHVDRTLSVASEVNQFMASHRFTDKLQQSWDVTRTDLNALALVYGLSPLD